MAGRGGGLTISTRLAVKLANEGKNSFKGADGVLYTVITCNRCFGAGNYSFNLMHGTMCYGCGGTGVVAVAGSPEEVSAAAQKKAAARERAAARRQAKADAAREAAEAEAVRLAALLGGTPAARPSFRTMTSRYDGRCVYCRTDLTAGDEIVYDGQARHLGCYGDQLLDDIDAARLSAEFDAALPY